jgi:hypothetical protein
MTMKRLRIAATILACLLAVTACSKEEAHEEPVAEEGHKLPAVDATASQDAEAAIAAAMAASPTALEAPATASPGAVAPSVAASSASAHPSAEGPAPAH